jgi:heptosyltransferase-2
MVAIKKILVIRLSSIGDIVLTTPLLRHLNTACPEAQLDYCTKLPFVSLLASNPRIAAIFTTELLPSGSYDLVVDLQNNFRSRAIVRSLQAGRIVHYSKGNWKKWLLVHFKLNLNGKYRSVVDRYLHSLKKVGISGDRLGCELYPSLHEKGFAAPFLKGGGKTLAICFGAKHFTKRYPPKQFATLISHLLNKKPLQLLLLGGTEDAPYATEILNILPDRFQSMVTNLAGRSSLMQSAAILERCDAVLCNDTGLMHIASAFGKKLFVLFGSSSAAFGFLPYHTQYDLFEVKGLSCRPCSHIGLDRCPKGHFRCMNDHSPALIAEQILDYLK